MSKKLIPVTIIACLSFASPLVRAQEVPVKVSGCELAQNPKNFDGKFIQVRGSLNVHFEDFTLGVRDCNSQQGIWLAFGGDVPGIVVSMMNDNFRQAGTELKINGVSYGIKKDDNFHKLYALIASRHGSEPDYTVTATLTGTFFAGEQSRTNRGSVEYFGYGHLGCCSLLVITQVSQVESTPPANLHVDGVVIAPDSKPIEGLTVINDVLGGSPPERQTTVTDKLGQFAFSNSGQQLRIESPKYRPLALTVNPGGEPVRIKLQNAKNSDWLVPVCGSPDSRSRSGFSVRFAVPPTMKSSLIHDENIEAFFIYEKGEQPETAKLIIRRSPERIEEAADSLDSNWFEQRWIKDVRGNLIGIDARGRIDADKYWRTVVFSGHDTVGYQIQARKRPIALDQIIDSACIAQVSDSKSQ